MLSVEKRDYPMKRFRIDARDFVYGGVLVFATVALRLAFGWPTTDDAYITFRYADNLAHGRGFVFNVGERVLGTTTPFFTMLMAVASILFGTPRLPLVANVVSLASDSVTAIFVYMLARAVWRHRVIALACGLMFAMVPDNVVLSTLGMESPFFTMLVVVGVWGALTNRQGIAYGCTSLATLTRPEGVLLWFFLTAALYAKRVPIRWRTVAIAALPVAAWAIFAWLYFGSIIPNSVRAKSVAYSSFDWNGDWLDRVIQRAFYWPNGMNMLYYFSGFFSKSHAKADFFYLTLAAALPIFVLFGMGVAELKRYGREWLVMPAFVATLAIGYAFADTLFFGWYILPVAPFTVLCLVAGVRYLARLQAELVSLCREWRWLRPAKLSVIGAFFLVANQAYFWHEVNEVLKLENILPSQMQLGFIPPTRELAYAEAAKRLAPRIQPGSRDRVLTAEVGIIAFYLPHARVYDTFGLVTPAAVEYYKRDKKANNAIVDPVIEILRPDFIVCLENWFASRHSPWFNERFRYVTKTHASGWGKGTVYVYERVADIGTATAKSGNSVASDKIISAAGTR
jgi:hypothetical protein